jgi:hypothetical protein
LHQISFDPTKGEGEKARRKNGKKRSEEMEKGGGARRKGREKKGKEKVVF